MIQKPGNLKIELKTKCINFYNLKQNVLKNRINLPGSTTFS
jgi:hypothetical protein